MDPVARILSRQEQDYVEARLAGLSAADAYRFAVNPDADGATASREGSKLAKRGPVTAALLQHRKLLLERQLVTRETHLAKLAELRDGAVEDKQFSAAITAETNRGKVAGLYQPENQITIDLGGVYEQVAAGNKRGIIDLVPEEKDDLLE